MAVVSLPVGTWSFTVVHHLSCQAKLSTYCAVSDLFAQSYETELGLITIILLRTYAIANPATMMAAPAVPISIALTAVLFNSHIDAR